MTSIDRFALTIGAAALIAGCGALGAMPQQLGMTRGNTAVHGIVNGSSYRVLHSFGSGSDGAEPVAALTNMGGVLYSTTSYGGAYNHGTVFSITTKGEEQVLYSFGRRGSDGADPQASLIDVDGTLYGTTYSGGGPQGFGTVYSVSATGKERVLHRFTGGRDGAHPTAELLYVNGLFYGTTQDGGTSDLGTVYRVSTSGAESVLHSFTGVTGRDGAHPHAGLINVDGTLYGTTTAGGKSKYSKGTVFIITTAGEERVLYSFTDYYYKGGAPYATLLDVKSRLYGTTALGGSYERGTIFSINTNGRKERASYSFLDAYPEAGLIDVQGTLYGTTMRDGEYLDGTLYSLGAGKFQVLHDFGKTGYDGLFPSGELIDVNHTLYGTTQEGGKYDHFSSASKAGTVFALRL